MKLEPSVVRSELGYENARTASEVTDRINAGRAVKVQEKDIVEVLAWSVRSGSVASFVREGETYYFRK